MDARDADGQRTSHATTCSTDHATPACIQEDCLWRACQRSDIQRSNSCTCCAHSGVASTCSVLSHLAAWSISSEGRTEDMQPTTKGAPGSALSDTVTALAAHPVGMLSAASQQRVAWNRYAVLYRTFKCSPGSCCAATQVIAPSFTHRLRHDYRPCCTAAQRIQLCGQLAQLACHDCWPCCATT
jgi:hypothetical protein